MHKNNHNYNVFREKYSMHLYVVKEENSPIKTYAAIYMHYNFEMKKNLITTFTIVHTQTKLCMIVRKGMNSICV